MSNKNKKNFILEFSWGWNRIRCMSLFEICYRFKSSLLAELQCRGLFTAEKVPPPDLSYASNNWLNNAREVIHSRYYENAESILNGQVKIFALEKLNIDLMPDWNRAPRTGRQTTLSFGKKLNYRNQEIVGDIKYLWEPNRQLQLVTLAQAYYLSGEQRYLDGLAAQLNSWFEACQYLKGPNWTSSLELGIRLINWSIVWQLIGGFKSPLFQGMSGRSFLNRWLVAIYRHAHFIRGYFSSYSSANNHLIGEAAGLFVATVAWPFWPVFIKWQEFAKAILEEEVLKQNAEDGVNREQAISYQQFVLDFLITSALAARANDINFSSKYWSRVESMLDYLASVIDVEGNLPMIGDADDGYVTKLSSEETFCPYRSLLATGAVVFDRDDFKAKAGRLDDKTRWLLGNSAEEAFSEIPKPQTKSLPVHRAFPEGGYYILGKDFETENEVRCIVDCGPLGYLSIAAHGHADALAIYLSVSGREFLIDTGTYAYHTKKRWRDYFRGTSAHNTVRIDGENQSVISGNFMWKKKANAFCELFEPGEAQDVFAGHHDGYLRLRDPVLHRREIKYLKSENEIIVSDCFECKGLHTVERLWHFSEHCSVLVDNRTVVATNDGIEVRLEAMEDDGAISLHRGDDLIPLGWVSRRFDVKVPTTTLVMRNTIRRKSLLTTNIIIKQ